MAQLRERGVIGGDGDAQRRRVAGQERGELAVEPLEELDLEVRAPIVRGDVGALEVEDHQVAIAELARGEPELEREVGVEVGGDAVAGDDARAHRAGDAEHGVVAADAAHPQRPSAGLDHADAMQPAGAAGEDDVGERQPVLDAASG